jgi:hypothetical protein
VADRVAEAMQSLYAVEPDRFMTARSELVAKAKADGDAAAAKEIGKLRKPSLAAWAVNVAAREARDAVDGLLDVGERMRSAQSRLDAKALTELRPERDKAVEAFVAAATAVAQEAGRTLSPTVQQDVRATAVAALADEGAAAAVGSGQLTRALSYSGFGEVDLAEAVARTAGGAILTVIEGQGAGRGRAKAGKADDAASADEADAPEAGEPDEERAAREAAERAAALERARADLEAAEDEVARARERAEETRQRLAVVERQLAKAREADERALEAVTEAVRRRKAAEAAVAELESS